MSENGEGCVGGFEGREKYCNYSLNLKKKKRREEKRQASRVPTWEVVSLIVSGSLTKVSQTGWLLNQIYLLEFWRLESLFSKCLQV